MKPRVILDSKKFALTIDRLCHQLIEVHHDFAESALLGVQPRGVYVANRIHHRLCEILHNTDIKYGKLDITFHRDDFRRSDRPLTPNKTEVNFQIENRRIILIDDVLFTGRTIRSAIDAMMDYGRPSDVELLVLVDRRLQRHLPIQAKYVGKTIDSIESEIVKVDWKELDGADNIWLIPAKEKKA